MKSNTLSAEQFGEIASTCGEVTAVMTNSMAGNHSIGETLGLAVAMAVRLGVTAGVIDRRYWQHDGHSAAARPVLRAAENCLAHIERQSGEKYKRDGLEDVFAFGSQWALSDHFLSVGEDAARWAVERHQAGRSDWIEWLLPLYSSFWVSGQARAKASGGALFDANEITKLSLMEASLQAGYWAEYIWKRRKPEALVRSAVAGDEHAAGFIGVMAGLFCELVLGPEDPSRPRQDFRSIGDGIVMRSALQSMLIHGGVGLMESAKHVEALEPVASKVWGEFVKTQTGAARSSRAAALRRAIASNLDQAGRDELFTDLVSSSSEAADSYMRSLGIHRARAA